MDRIKALCSYLDKCGILADVGCDHGYCTKYALDNGICKSAVVTDISQKCLDKAEKLLAPYISRGQCTSICCNGLEKVNEDIEQVLIAGMGGEEIISILNSSFIPEKFLLQPMHNVRKVREYLIDRGASITVDEPFLAGEKFYFVIKGEREGESKPYSEVNFEFGTNLKSEITIKYLSEELKKLKSYGSESQYHLAARIKLIEGVLKGEYD